MQNIPLFGSSASKITPPTVTVTSGYFPLQLLPAENLNYYLNGATQAIQELVNVIEAASLSPSTSLQLLTSLQTLFAGKTSGVPVGAMCPFAGTVAPSGFLFCGQTVSRTTYSGLFAVIGTTWGAGNGSTTFDLPNWAEAVPVGVGTRASGVTAHDTYALAEFKDDQLEGHFHESEGWSSGSGGSGINFLTVSNGSGALATTVKNVGAPKTDGINGTPRTGTTTRGKQLGTNWIIKY